MSPKRVVAKTEMMADGSEVQTFVLSHDSGIKAEIMTYGGIIRTLTVPDRSGNHRSVVLGLNSLQEYVSKSPYFGAIIGRYANRIANGRFELDGETFSVTVNDGTGSLHGGAKGFDSKIWAVQEFSGSMLALSYVSESGEEGYPGEVEVRVTYTLLDSRTLRIDYAAKTTAATPLSLTNHSYFNLAGEGAGTALRHRAQIAADSFLPVGPDLIPTGEVRDVEDSAMDFRAPTVIEDRIRNASEQMVLSRGYDHNWVLSRERIDASGLAFAARFEEPRSGRSLEIWTSEPMADFYTGNFLDATLVGPSGRTYRQGDAFAFEPERASNGPNSGEAETAILRPSDSYISTTEYRFGIVKT